MSGLASRIAISAALAAVVPAPAWAQKIAWQTAPSPIPAGQRKITFAVPLVYGERVLGDVVVETSPYGGETRIERESLRLQLAQLLNEDGLRALDDVLGSAPFVTPARLAAAGFPVRFDDGRLELVVETLAGEYRPVSSLGGERYSPIPSELPTIEPAEFSAYMNINANLDYSDSDGADEPSFFAFGAARYRDVVLEFDGALTGQFGEDYRFYRRSVRAIYDDPESYRRYQAGDLRLNTIPVLRTPFIGGLAVEKRRRIFDPFIAVPLLSGREIFLDSRSDVEVIVNDDVVRSLQLEPGRYDFSNLPLETGSNDVRVVITDSAGRRQAIDLDYFFEPLDLAVGEDEYVLGAGFIARDIEFEPDYTGDPVVTGYYRRALNEQLILGGALEISEDVQVIAAETTFVPQVIPGVIDAQIATSFAEGTGLSVRAGYRVQGGNSLANRRQLSVTVDYESANYTTIGDIFPSDFDLLTVSGSYTQSLTERTYASAGVLYSKRGGNREDRKLAFVDVFHRLTDRMRLTGGLVFGEDEFTSKNFGVHLGLAWQFGDRSRLNADYRSRRETTRLTASRGSDNSVGSFGYDVGFSDTRGSTSVDGSVNYVGNRFDARATVISSGTGFGDLTSDQRARLQIGTSLAYADGSFGIGRPIFDSFAVLKPNNVLRDQEVISGRSLSNNEYTARSGPLGAAVQSDLSSYNVQSIQFDLQGADQVVAVGDGTARVEPRFRSGYKIVVGDSRFVSAVGTLSVGGSPAELWSGTITSVDDEGFKPMPFFTNSRGRFGIIGLSPGKTYSVTISREGREFEITVPEDNTGLLRLDEVDLPASED